MKSGFIVFVGLFIALAASWAALVLGPNAQLAALTPYYDQVEGKTFPERAPGIAARGKLVYQDLGCAACHTQAVRRPGFGSDIARKWGERQSYARDYLYQDRADLGQLRVGPDLANVGARLKTKKEIFAMLYSGGATMPAYKFLFEERMGQSQPSSRAVDRVGNVEIVPSARAEELAAYLLSLNVSYDYPPEAGLNKIEAAKAPAGKAEGGKAESKEAEKK